MGCLESPEASSPHRDLSHQARRARGAAVAWCALSLLVACGDGSVAEPQAGALPPFDPSACRALTAPRQILNEAHTTGPVNNDVVVDGEVAWVVHSLDNTVGRLSLDSGRFDASFIDVGNERNPWSVAPTGQGTLLVTNLLSDSVSLISASDGAVLFEHTTPALEAPTGVAVLGGVALVANSHFVGPGFEPGSVEVFEVGEASLTHLGRVQTSALNPLDVVADAARRRFYVVQGGELGTTGQSGSFVPQTPGAVDVLSLDALLDGRLNEAVEAVVSLPLNDALPEAGSPRTLVMTPAQDVAYLPSGTAPHLYKLDLESLTLLRGTEDPIEVYLGEGNQLTGLAMRADGVGYVTAFNQDALYMFDASCDASVLGPFELGNAALLEGPIDLAYDAARGQALVLLNLSSALSVVKD